MVSRTEQDSPAQLPFSAAQLEKLGVRIQSRFDLSLECLSCGEVWSPQRDSGGTLVRGYWKCPNGCNR